MNPENLISIIKQRRSIYPKDYNGQQIPKKILDEILDSAQFAPSHKKTKPWRFRVLQNDDLRNLGIELQKIYKENTPENLFLEKKYQDIALKISQSNAVIPIVVDFSKLVPEWEEIAATAMAVQNMYLTCTINGVGCYWSSPAIAQKLEKFLNLEENQRCLGLFYMGMV